MRPERFPPDDPREWMNRARSNLARAKGGPNSTDVYLEDLCFDAQQAAEKALKGLLIALGVRFPYTHDLGELIDLLEASGQEIPEAAHRAGSISVFAWESRYPNVSEPATAEEYREAVAIAEAVVRWVEGRLTQTE